MQNIVMVKSIRPLYSLLIFGLMSLSQGSYGFILPDTRNTSELREFTGGLFCNGTEVGGKIQGIYLPKISNDPDPAARFCSKGKLIYKAEVIVTLSFPSFSGMPIDKAAEEKERMIHEIESKMGQIFLDETVLGPAPENGRGCLGPATESTANNQSSASSLVVIKDFSLNAVKPSWNVFFNLDEIGKIQDVDLKWGSFLATNLSIFADTPRVYTFDGIHESSAMEFKPEIRHQYWTSRTSMGIASYAPVYFKDLRDLRDKYVLVGNGSEAPSQLLEKSEQKWSGFIQESTKVTKQVFQDRVRFLTALDFGEMCTQMVERHELTEK